MPWSNSQKAVVKQYQRYAGLPNLEYRALLREQTGATSSRDAHLTQFHFDAFMPLIEVRAHLAHTNGLAVGRPPAHLSNWYYWRNRAPARGKASSREIWKITNTTRTGLWDLLVPSLPESQRTHEYLCGIASHATGRDVVHLHDLTTAEAGSLIQALKDRLRHALRRRPGTADLPIGTPDPSDPSDPSDLPTSP